MHEPGELPGPIAWRRVVAAGLTVAVLDFSYVTLLWVVILKRTTFTRLAQSVATGLLGRGAFEGGLPTAVLGLSAHVTIAFIWTLLFLLASRKVAALRNLVSRVRGRVLAGLAFGPVVWLTMDLVVLPLSRARATPVTSVIFYVNLVQHALMVGLPMVLILGSPASSTAGAAAPSR